MTDRPSGTVTFLFTDIEGSTRQWESDPDAMRVELAAHDDVLRRAVGERGGWLFKHTGDGICAAFHSARAAVDAAAESQVLLRLPVRMGIASGEAELRGDDYFGSTLNSAARVMDAGHGGQVLVAASTAGLVSGVDLLELGPRRLRDLSGPVELFQLTGEGLRLEFPPLRTLDVVPGNLPTQATSFLGRDDAIDIVVEAVGEHRIITLIGVGGVGKTRLALQCASAVAGRFRDGVWFVELASVTDDGGVDAAVASVFAVQPQAGRTWRQVVVESLSGRELLLLVDNCEHVLDEVASLLEAIVAECASVSVLVTSRESLSVGAEWAWRVPSLTASGAAALFVERAEQAASGFRANGADEAVIGEICARLDAIPLAIELAAARVRSMSPTQIRDRLDERFRLLTGARRSIERHQTLRHAVQWSYDLLDATEQRMLRHVSVFAGGFTLDAVTAVFDGDGIDLDEFEVLDVLDSLVRKSLLLVDRSGIDVRYGLLETIRQFAEEALAAADESDAARDRHAAFFATRSQFAVEQLGSEDEQLAYLFVNADLANLSAAFGWALARDDADPAVRIAAQAHQVARLQLRTETFAWPEEALDIARQSEHRQLPYLLSQACDSATAVSRFDDAVRYGLEAIDSNDDDRYDVSSLAYLVTGFALAGIGDVDQSLDVMRTGAEHPADHPSRGNLAYLHVIASMVGREFSEHETNEAIAQLAASPMPTIRACGIWVQAMLAAKHDVPAAIALYQQAIDLAVASGGRTVEQTCRGMQIGLLAQSDDLHAALPAFASLVDTWKVMGDVYTGSGVSQLAALLDRLGYHEGAAQLWGAVMRGRQDTWIATNAEYATASNDEPAFATAFETGAALDLASASQLAHQLIAQARIDHTET